MSAPMVARILCRDCDWQPDPERRMSPDNQAQEHTDKAGHTTESGLVREDK